MAGNTVTRNMAGSQRLLFITGLLMAAISAVLVFVIATTSGGGDGAASVAVVTAKDLIPAQTRITHDMLKIVYFERDAVLEDAYTSRSHVLDRVTTKEINPGAQIVPSMLSVATGDGLQTVISPGKRAVSIEVEEVVTAGGNLEPGDRVDVIGLFEVTGDPSDILAILAPGQNVIRPAKLEPDTRSVLTVTLLQDIRVLGLAQSLAPEASDSTSSTEEAEAQPGASTATLELTPEQAQTLTMADEYGVLRMAARPPGDAAVAPVPATIIPIERTQ